MSVDGDVLAPSRILRFRAASSAYHQRVDDRVMQAAPFASRQNYARFLRFQYRLHRRVAPLYAAPAYQALLPDLASRERLSRVESDLLDLGLARPEIARPDLAEPAALLPLPEALGWLYVVEGSNMGAAFLLKAAIKLDLSERFGARHLAAHPEGRGLNWRRFTEALDAIALTAEEDRRAQAATISAFSHVLDLVGEELA
ncbi:MAG TPA: biliverdin-producing heme oxygenase [Xanthobacteraceae bacterium]|jgi:heme oxygenase|nr:biliverdin-producing heme oxygenase [Xanthobacteraceae bacterium]HQS46294.1 biliverdin-producing heme oxygenase [Xanthobacteraceae bacterium]